MGDDIKMFEDTFEEYAAMLVDNEFAHSVDDLRAVRELWALEVFMGHLDSIDFMQKSLQFWNS